MSYDELTPDDWVEIYSALEYKLTSPAIGSDSEGRRWAAHLRRIMRTVGPDGCKMADVNRRFEP